MRKNAQIFVAFSEKLNFSSIKQCDGGAGGRGCMKVHVLLQYLTKSGDLKVIHSNYYTQLTLNLYSGIIFCKQLFTSNFMKV